MDDYLAADPRPESPDFDTAVAEKTSTRYAGRWNRLVSTTNWEKGRIISAWRKSLTEAGAPPEACSDEAWSRRVGGVSAQHVGRLRRVHERFGAVHKQYRGLYWSHFHAALDWNDAEMWLEGAVQNRWSVAQMRTTRWEAMGAPAHKKPRPEDVIVAELDEDVDLGLAESGRRTVGKSTGAVRDVPPDEADEPIALRPFRPFEDVAALPKDLAKAFAAFERAIQRQKRSGWQEVSRDEVLAVLDALKELALAPSDS